MYSCPFVLCEADNAFINMVSNRITAYGHIPYTVPVPLIVDIIKESAKFFYDNWWGSSENSFWTIDSEDIKHYIQNWHVGDPRCYKNGCDTTRQSLSYSITLPKKIQNVLEIYEIGKAVDNDINSNTMTEQSQFLASQSSSVAGMSLIGINNNLYIQERVCRMIERTAIKSVTGTMVPFNFNTLTNNLIIHQEINYNLALRCLSSVNVECLYNNEMFTQYVILQCKRELKRIIGGHSVELPGGVTLNVDEICDTEDLESLKERIKASSGIGDVILQKS